MTIKEKDEVVSLIKENRIIAIIRTDDYKRTLKAAEAIIDGGIRALEFSYTMGFVGELISEISKKICKKCWYDS